MYPIQPYNPINGALADQQFNRAMFNGNNGVGVVGGDEGDLLGSLFGLANRLMGEILRSGPNADGAASFMGSDPHNPHLKVFGVSSMNVTQLSRGVDGRPHIIESHDERWMGPDGVWQTKKALRDPERGIEKIQVGRFAGDRGEVIEHRLDPSTGRYREEIQQNVMAPNQPNYPLPWRKQSQQAMQRQPSLPSPQYQYYPKQQQQQQLPPYAQSLQHYSPYSQQPQQLPPYTQKSQQFPPYTKKPQQFPPYGQQPYLTPSYGQQPYSNSPYRPQPQQPSPYGQQLKQALPAPSTYPYL
jgi:hypothetical protein